MKKLIFVLIIIFGIITACQTVKQSGIVIEKETMEKENYDDYSIEFQTHYYLYMPQIMPTRYKVSILDINTDSVITRYYGGETGRNIQAGDTIKYKAIEK